MKICIVDGVKTNECIRGFSYSIESESLRPQHLQTATEELLGVFFCLAVCFLVYAADLLTVTISIL